MRPEETYWHCSQTATLPLGTKEHWKDQKECGCVEKWECGHSRETVMRTGNCVQSEIHLKNTLEKYTWEIHLRNTLEKWESGHSMATVMRTGNRSVTKEWQIVIQPSLATTSLLRTYLIVYSGCTMHIYIHTAVLLCLILYMIEIYHTYIKQWTKISQRTLYVLGVFTLHSSMLRQIV